MFKVNKKCTRTTSFSTPGVVLMSLLLTLNILLLVLVFLHSSQLPYYALQTCKESLDHVKSSQRFYEYVFQLFYVVDTIFRYSSEGGKKIRSQELLQRQLFSVSITFREFLWQSFDLKSSNISNPSRQFYVQS